MPGVGGHRGAFREDGLTGPAQVPAQLRHGGAGGNEAQDAVRAEERERQDQHERRQRTGRHEHAAPPERTEPGHGEGHREDRREDGGVPRPSPQHTVEAQGCTRDGDRHREGHQPRLGAGLVRALGVPGEPGPGGWPAAPAAPDWPACVPALRCGASVIAGPPIRAAHRRRLPAVRPRRRRRPSTPRAAASRGTRPRPASRRAGGLRARHRVPRSAP